MNSKMIFKSVLAVLCAGLVGSVQANSSPSSAKLEKCFDRKNCGFHIVGGGTLNPYLLLSVHATEAMKWTEQEWQAARAAAEEKTHWARSNPGPALEHLAGIPPDAPAASRLAWNLQKRLLTYHVGVSDVRMTRGPKKGQPGWDTPSELTRKYSLQ
jgi:hypothetical protein